MAAGKLVDVPMRMLQAYLMIDAVVTCFSVDQNDSIEFSCMSPHTYS